MNPTGKDLQDLFLSVLFYNSLLPFPAAEVFPFGYEKKQGDRTSPKTMKNV